MNNAMSFLCKALLFCVLFFYTQYSWGVFTGFDCVNPYGICNVLAKEWEENIIVSGGVVGKKITCHCYNDIDEDEVVCQPSNMECYDVSYYPNIICNPGYKKSGNTCVPCSPCVNCNSDTSWSTYTAGYQRKTIRTCECGTCVTTYSYRCNNGYYGSASVAGNSGCYSCPPSGSSEAGDNSLITKCYAWPYINSDLSGDWEFINKCFYLQ